MTTGRHRSAPATLSWQRRLDHAVRHAAFLLLLGTVGFVMSGPFDAEAPEAAAATTLTTTEPAPEQPGPVDGGATESAKPVVQASMVDDSGTPDPIPSAAGAAYMRASQAINAADPTCHLPWTLLAGAGWVESRHGAQGRSRLDIDGVASPPLYGAITSRTDTDAAKWDGTASMDRAVGPFHFSPTDWTSFGVDGDGDGLRNPQDIDDASLSYGVVLCSGPGDLRQEPAVAARLLQVNPAKGYRSAVLRSAAFYRDHPAVKAAEPAPTFAVVVDDIDPGATPSNSSSSSSPSPTSKPTPKASSSPKPSPKPSPTASASTTKKPSPSPTKQPTATVSPTGTAMPATSSTGF